LGLFKISLISDMVSLEKARKPIISAFFKDFPV
jgi:hypothetical protein